MYTDIPLLKLARSRTRLSTQRTTLSQTEGGIDRSSVRIGMEGALKRDSGPIGSFPTSTTSTHRGEGAPTLRSKTRTHQKERLIRLNWRTNQGCGAARSSSNRCGQNDVADTDDSESGGASRINVKILKRRHQEAREDAIGHTVGSNRSHRRIASPPIA